MFGEAWKEINHASLKAYFGLLLLAGVYRSCGEAMECLWDDVKGRPIFKATMSLRRFQNISRVLRFDDKSDRADRRARDKLAPIRVLWDKWANNLKILYNPNECVTVDEQLVAYRGKCPFRQYIPSKPAKYGIKIWALCDSNTNYAWSMQVYTGRNRNCVPEKNQGMRVVLELAEGLKGRNITCDNFFTTYDLAVELLKKKMTIVGTVRKNKVFLPPHILDMRKKPAFYSEFLFEHKNKVTLVAYVPKKYRCVYLISTLHQDAQIQDNQSTKPEIIEYYNHTKAGVDTLDQLVATYTCKRKTNRWPVALFANMLDVSACNAFVIWTAINPEWNRSKHFRRRLFLEELGFELLEDEKQQRKTQPYGTVARKLHHPQEEKNTKRGRCHFCENKSNSTKYNTKCMNCNLFVCKNHSHVEIICNTCNKK